MTKPLCRAALNAALAVVFCSYTQAAIGQTGPFENEGSYLQERWEHTEQLYPDKSVGLIRALQINVDDQVDGRCWTNASAVAARLRAELERSGVAAYQEPLASNWIFSPVLEFTIVGYRTRSGLCVASASIKVRHEVGHQLGSLQYTGNVFELKSLAAVWERMAVFTSGSDLDEQALSLAQEWVDTLVADIAHAQRNPIIQEMLGNWDDPVMTRQEFDALLNE